MANKEKSIYLDGYYAPEIGDDFEQWSNRWSMGPHADVGWVFFNGEELTEGKVREILQNPGDRVYTQEEYELDRSMFNR